MSTDPTAPHDDEPEDELDDLLESGLRRALSAAPPPAADEARSGTSCGRIELGELIARGGIGLVYRGRDERIGREVAVKVLRDRGADDPGLVSRFIAEARICGRLQHPGVVPVYDLGLDEQDRPFFSMKLVDGVTLAAILAGRAGPEADRPRLLGIFDHVCQAMAYAHDQRVIHRDLKPSNVMVGRFGEVQVVDWGFAKILGESAPESPSVPNAPGRRAGDESSWSLAGSVFGTPAYMAPEQARGEVAAIDERADVFSLGGVLCEILTGAPPYRAASGEELLELAARGDLADARARLERCTGEPELVRIARSCLEADRDHRPRHAGELVAGLERHLAAREAAAREAIVDAAEARGRLAHERKARRLTTVLAVVIALVLVGGVVALFQLDRARRDELSRTESGVRAALQSAVSRGRGQSWEAADEALHRARLLMNDVGVPRALRDEVESAATRLAAERTVEAERLAAEGRESELLRRLLDLRAQSVETGESEADEYAAVFSDIGIAVDRMTPEEVAEAVWRERPAIQDALVSALDEWASRRQATNDPESPSRSRPRDPVRSWEHLVRCARAADADAWRQDLRRALLTQDREQLEALAREDDVAGRAPQSLVLLAFGLGRLGNPDAALAVLQISVRAHADDLWSHHELAALLGRRAGSRPEPERSALRAEAQRHAWCAMALQPASVFLREHLGQLCALTGDAEEAVHLILDEPRFSQLERRRGLRTIGRRLPWAERLAFLEIWQRRDPDESVARSMLAATLLAGGRLEEAEVAARQAIALEDDEPGGHAVLGAVLFDTGRYVEALDHLERGLRGAPWDRLKIEAGHLAAAEVLDSRPAAALAEGLRRLHQGDQVGAASAFARVLGPRDGRGAPGPPGPPGPGGPPRRRPGPGPRVETRELLLAFAGAIRSGAVDAASRDRYRELIRRLLESEVDAADRLRDGDRGGLPRRQLFEALLHDPRLDAIRTLADEAGLDDAERERWRALLAGVLAWLDRT